MIVEVLLRLTEVYRLQTAAVAGWQLALQQLRQPTPTRTREQLSRFWEIQLILTFLQLRNGRGYQKGRIFRKVPNALCLPLPLFWKIIL